MPGDACCQSRYTPKTFPRRISQHTVLGTPTFLIIENEKRFHIRFAPPPPPREPSSQRPHKSREQPMSRSHCFHSWSLYRLYVYKRPGHSPSLWQSTKMYQVSHFQGIECDCCSTYLIASVENCLYSLVDHDCLRRHRIHRLSKGLSLSSASAVAL